MSISNTKRETEDYVTINTYNTLNNEWRSSFELRSHIIESIRDKIDPNVERYHCEFCIFNETIRNVMVDHYYQYHEKELRELSGASTERKIDLLITNGSKSYGDPTIRYRTAQNIFDHMCD